jgi:excisionase family DNA binding protein
MLKDPTPELLTAHEVSAIFRVEVGTIYSAAAAGKLPAVRLWRGRRKSLLRFRRRDIEELIRRGSPSQESSRI